MGTLWGWLMALPVGSDPCFSVELSDVATELIKVPHCACGHLSNVRIREVLMAALLH